jgi:signal transduction histidine kinase
VLGSDSNCEFSGQYLHPKKGPLWIRIECAKTEDSDGLRLTGIILDQSTRHQLELEREVTMRELKLRNEEQESVLYATSHDLKTPLVNIRGFAGELEEMLRAIRNARPDFDKDDEVLEKFKESAQAIGFIQRNMARMESLIQNLLHVMRAGRVPLVMETVNLNQIIQSVLQVLHHQVQKAEAEIHVADLPPCTADVMQMEMIFTNLLDNALKFRKPDQPMLIEVGASVEGAKVILFVRDNGRGFEPRYVNKVFELFHRLTPNANEAGDGIGLTLVRRAMLRLGGSIRAESELGIGSTFWLELQR